MRQAYAHDAVLDMAPDADTRAPGAAITVALCGHWDHQPPCPLAPHHTAADRVDDEVRLRILFATEPEREDLVRQRIDAALSGGEQRGPDGAGTRWRLRGSRAGEITPAEVEHAERLTRS
jgi:hypothetical protein